MPVSSLIRCIRSAQDSAYTYTMKQRCCAVAHLKDSSIHCSAIKPLRFMFVVMPSEIVCAKIQKIFHITTKEANEELKMQGVAHALLLGLQVTIVILVGCHLDRHILDDFQSVGFQTDTLGGVVGHQAHLVNA